jgi:hypothetical protein
MPRNETVSVSLDKKFSMENETSHFYFFANIFPGKIIWQAQ